MDEEIDPTPMPPVEVYDDLDGVLRLRTQDGTYGPPLTMNEALALSACLAGMAATMGRD